MSPDSVQELNNSEIQRAPDYRLFNMVSKCIKCVSKCRKLKNKINNILICTIIIQYYSTYCIAIHNNRCPYNLIHCIQTCKKLLFSVFLHFYCQQKKSRNSLVENAHLFTRIYFWKKYTYLNPFYIHRRPLCMNFCFLFFYSNAFELCTVNYMTAVCCEFYKFYNESLWPNIHFYSLNNICSTTKKKRKKRIKTLQFWNGQLGLRKLV